MMCLLSNGARVDLAAKDGYTPLYMASDVCECHHAVVECV